MYAREELLIALFLFAFVPAATPLDSPKFGGYPAPQNDPRYSQQQTLQGQGMQVAHADPLGRHTIGFMPPQNDPRYSQQQELQGPMQAAYTTPFGLKQQTLGGGYRPSQNDPRYSQQQGLQGPMQVGQTTHLGLLKIDPGYAQQQQAQQAMQGAQGQLPNSMQPGGYYNNNNMIQQNPQQQAAQKMMAQQQQQQMQAATDAPQRGYQRMMGGFPPTSNYPQQDFSAPYGSPMAYNNPTTMGHQKMPFNGYPNKAYMDPAYTPQSMHSGQPTFSNYATFGAKDLNVNKLLASAISNKIKNKRDKEIDRYWTENENEDDNNLIRETALKDFTQVTSKAIKKLLAPKYAGLPHDSNTPDSGTGPSMEKLMALHQRNQFPNTGQQQGF